MRPAPPLPWRALAVAAVAIVIAVSTRLAHAAAPSSPAPRVLAVAYFENRSEQPQWQPLAKGLADMLVTDLTGTDGLTVVERDRLQSVLAEIELGKSKFVDAKSARKLGRGLGASHVLVGAFQVFGGKLRVDARAVEVETGAIAFAAEHTGDADDVFAVEERLATKLRGGLGLAPRGVKLGATRISVDDLRAYGSGLDALDEGRLDEARRILGGLSAKRPDFAEARRGLDRLAQRIHAMLAESKLAPERLVVLARELAGGKLDACAPLFTELGAMQSTTTQATTAILRPDGSRREDLAKVLAAHYATTLLLLESEPLTRPICPGDQIPAAAGLAYFFFAMHLPAKQVMDCHPTQLAQATAPQIRANQCARILERVPDLADAQGRVVVAASEYPSLMLQLGQLALERFPRSPFTPSMLPILQGYVEHAKLASLEGDAKDRAIAAAKAAKARAEFAQATGYADLPLVDVRIPRGERERTALPGANARMTMLLGEGPIALGLDRVELSVDGGETFSHAWPRRDEAPGAAAPHLKLDLAPSPKPLVGIVDRRRSGREGPPEIDVAAGQWFRSTAWLGELWTPENLGRVRFRLVALDGTVLGRCAVTVDADATERTRDGWLVARAACRSE
jgi:TolB-like protein